MHEQAPPRFATVGEPVELAPRAPDPNAKYEWSVGNVDWECEEERDSESVAFSRESSDERVVVVLNSGESAREVTVDAGIDDTDLVTGEQIPTATIEGTTLSTTSVVARVTE